MTVKESHKGFDKYVLEHLEVKNTQGEKTIIVSPDTSIIERTFKIVKQGHDVYHYFPDAIVEPLSFTVVLSGYAIRSDGTISAFKRIQDFTYNGG